MTFQPYREGMYIVDFNSITAYYPQVPWAINAQHIEYFSERLYQSGGQYIYEISIKARNWDMPGVLGNFVYGKSGMPGQLMHFAARNNIAYRPAVPPSQNMYLSSQQSYNMQANGHAGKRKRPVKPAAIAAGILVIILIAVISLYQLGSARFTEWDRSMPVNISEIFSDGNTESASEKITPSDKPQTAGEIIRVTFPAGTISRESELTIKKANKPIYLKDTDTVLTICDINLASGEELAGNVKIEIPYEASELPEGVQTEKSVGALYYNEDADEWEAVPCAVDGGKGVVILYTDHFSTYAAAVSKAPGITSKGRVAIDAPAPLVVPDIAPRSYDNAVLDSILTNLPKSQEEGNSTFMKKGWEIFNTAYSFGTVGTGLMEDVLDIKYFEKFNAAALELGGAMAVGQVAYDLYKGDTAAAIKDGVPASIYYTIGKIGTKGMRIASAGVFFIDYSMTKMGESALEGRYEKYKNAYTKYYADKKKGEHNVNYWSKLIYEAIQTSNSPEEADKKIRTKIDDYAMEFWRDPERGAYILDEQGHAAGGDVNLTNEETARIANNFKAELWNTIIRDAVEMAREKIYMEEKKDVQNRVMEYRKEISRKHNIIVIIENADQIDDIKECEMRLIDSQGNKLFAKNFGVTGTCKFEATCYGLQQNGFPNSIEIYAPAGKNHGEIRDKINFKLQENETYISVNVKLTKPNTSSGPSEFTGEWKLTDVKITDVLASENFWKDRCSSWGKSMDNVKDYWREDYLSRDMYFFKPSGEISIGIPSFQVPAADEGKYYIQYNYEQYLKDKGGRAYYRTSTFKTDDVQDNIMKVVSTGYILAGYTMQGEYHYDDLEMNMELKDKDTITGTAVRKAPNYFNGQVETITIKYSFTYKRLSSKPSLEPEIKYTN